MMNRDALGAIGQMLSAAALAFVILQVRDARKQMRRKISEARHYAQGVLQRPA